MSTFYSMHLLRFFKMNIAVIAVFLKNYLRTERNLAKSKAEIIYTKPPPIAEMLCVKNGRAIVVWGIFMN